VQQNTGEVFAIVRKRLFDALPSPDRIDEVAQAYVAALHKAKRVDTIPTTPETYIAHSTAQLLIFFASSETWTSDALSTRDEDYLQVARNRRSIRQRCPGLPRTL